MAITDLPQDICSDSITYINILVKHKARHEAKGNGFGYEIRDLYGQAGAIVCGRMDRE